MKLLKPDPEIEALARQVGGPEKLPWYNAKLDKVAGPMGELLQEYGRIPPGEMLQHVQTIVRVPRPFPSPNNFSQTAKLIHNVERRCFPGGGCPFFLPPASMSD
jgi:hypothetical protein